MKKRIIVLLTGLILTGCSNSTSSFATSLISSNTSTSFLTSTPSNLDYLEVIDGVKYGETKEIEYTSKVTNSKKHATIHLPNGYDENNEYPVLYLLHGMFGNHESWFKSCNADIIVDNLITFNNVKPMIVVGVNCIINETEKEPNISTDAFTETYDLTGRELTESLIPYINENYSTKTDKDNTALAGYSMGGRETLLSAFTYQDYFSYLGAFSSASFNKNILTTGTSNPVLTEFKIDPSSDGFKYILLAIGDDDLLTSGYTQKYSEMMTLEGIENEYLLLSGGHDFATWKKALLYFVNKLSW